VFAITVLLSCTPAQTAGVTDTHPVAMALPLIIKLKAEIEEDGRQEQKSFDKHQCWCEKTLERKAKDIADAKDTIDSLQKLITKLGGEIASHKAEIDQLQKDIAANLDSQKEATEIREEEFQEYNTAKFENEQCIGALESAIGVLTGAGTGKKKEGLLALPEAKILSVAADVRWIMQKPVAWRSTSPADMAVIRSFVTHSEDELRENGMSALQLRNNPFGDYAPQSTQIQGILKGMYDAFTADLEKDNAEEAEKQKAFEEFMKTKGQEQATLKLTLEKHEDAKAKKSKVLADSKTDRDDTKEQLEADEVFFGDTKTSCQNVASVWSERSRLRTEELQGIITAIKILKDGDSTFKKATATLLQVQQVHSHQGSDAAPKQAFQRLRNLAASYKSFGLAQIAAQMRMGGHFDKVMVMIDHMIERIREEEAEDIAHRDRCQNAEGKNKNDMEDVKAAQEETKEKIGRLKDKEKEIKGKIDDLETEIEDTEKKMEERLKLRNGEREDFEEALKVDQEAIDSLNQAITALMRFYKKNKIPLTLAQEDPKYSVDPDKAPDLEWAGEDSYGGRKEESTGIIAILSMIVEDYQNEMKTGRKQDAEAQEDYEQDRTAMEDVFRALKESHSTKENELAETQDALRDAKAFMEQKEDEMDDEKDMKQTLTKDCEWLRTHFDTRRSKRKAELEGLAEAKNIIAGGGNADEFELD